MNASCSTSLMTRSPSPASISSPVAFSTEPDAPVSARSSSTRYAGASICSGRAYVFQPTTPIRRPAPIPASREGLGERSRPVAGLARQAEVLEQDAVHRQRRGAGRAPALVADEDRRRPGRRRRRGSPPRTAGRTRSGTRGSRCARGRRRRRGGRSRAGPSARGGARGGRRTAPAAARAMPRASRSPAGRRPRGGPSASVSSSALSLPRVDHGTAWLAPRSIVK